VNTCRRERKQLSPDVANHYDGFATWAIRNHIRDPPSPEATLPDSFGHDNDRQTYTCERALNMYGDDSIGVPTEASNKGSNPSHDHPKASNTDKVSAEDELRSNRSRTSRASTIIARIESFEEATCQTAGEALPPDDGSTFAYEAAQPASNRPEYYPFKGEVEYAQVAWWVRNRTSDQARDQWLKDPRLRALRARYFSCKNAHDVREKLLNMSSGNGSVVPQWTDTAIHTDGYKVRVRYRDAMAMIAFLIGHVPFEDDITYSPVRQYSESGQRVYDEMHTGDWWWDMQTRLPPGATVIPVILASDKTQLTAHTGDKKAWPVYLTIGNIRLKTRRAASRPALPLIGLLPSDNVGERTTKLAVLHRALAVVLQRKTYFSSTCLTHQRH